jgi:hypothetical protein
MDNCKGCKTRNCNSCIKDLAIFAGPSGKELDDRLKKLNDNMLKRYGAKTVEDVVKNYPNVSIKESV